MSKKPRYTGLLKKKITVRVPPTRPSLVDAFLDKKARKRRRMAEIDEWFLGTEAGEPGEGMRMVLAEQNRKLVYLADHYGLFPPKDVEITTEIFMRMMTRLATRLAMDYVPGFKFELKETKAKGAPTEWTTQRLTALVWDVERQQKENPGITVKGACEALAKGPRRRQPHGWQRYDAETLRRRYTEAKNGPVPTILRYSEDMIRKQGRDPNIELEKQMSADRPK